MCTPVNKAPPLSDQVLVRSGNVDQKKDVVGSGNRLRINSWHRLICEGISLNPPEIQCTSDPDVHLRPPSGGSMVRGRCFSPMDLRHERWNAWTRRKPRSFASRRGETAPPSISQERAPLFGDLCSESSISRRYDSSLQEFV